MSELLHHQRSFEDIEQLKKEIDETYRGVLELALDMDDSGKQQEVGLLKQEVNRLSTELEETYRGVIELATNLESDERKIKSLTEGAGLGLWEWQPETNQLTVSDEWLAITGLKSDDFNGMLSDWDALVHPDDLPELIKERNRFLRGDRQIFRSEHRLRTDSGDWIWVLANAKQTNMADRDKLVEVAGVLINIDIRKKTELRIEHLNRELEERNQDRLREVEHVNYKLLEEVREHQRTVQALRQAKRFADEANKEVRILSDRLSIAVKSAQIGIWEWNIANNKLQWDKRMLELYGLDESDLVNTYEEWERTVHPDDLQRCNKEIQKAIQSNVDFDSEFRVIWPDSSVHTIKANALFQRNEEGEAIRMTGVNYDVTDRNKMEAALVEARKKAEAANQAKSLFLANMSHELRTPLHAILGFSQIMQLDPELAEEHVDSLSIINNSGHHLTDLINDVLEVSHIEVGHVELRPIEFDLYEMIENIKSLFSLKVEQKNIYLNSSIDKNVPRHLRGDEGKLRQVLINLVGNAIKFTDKGGIDLNICLADSQKQLYFEVQDTGPGIGNEELGRLFQPFEQGIAGISKGGSGLGLMISREYIRLMGGDLSVNSKLGHGCTFSFLSTYEKPETQTLTHPEHNKNRVAKGLKTGTNSKTVLIVDDHQQSQTFMARLLSMLGFRTIVAKDGKQALVEFKAGHPDVIFMDMRLPIMDGYEAIQRIRKLKSGKTIPIISVTASILGTDMNKIHESGADGILIKPCKVTDITHILEEKAGIDFIYDSDLTVQQVRPTQKLTENAMIELPNEFRNKLRMATESGDIVTTRACLEEIRKSKPNIAAAISELVEQFNFESLLELLKTRK